MVLMMLDKEAVMIMVLSPLPVIGAHNLASWIEVGKQPCIRGIFYRALIKERGVAEGGGGAGAGAGELKKKKIYRILKLPLTAISIQLSMENRVEAKKKCLVLQSHQSYIQSFPAGSMGPF